MRAGSSPEFGVMFCRVAIVGYCCSKLVIVGLWSPPFSLERPCEGGAKLLKLGLGFLMWGRLGVVQVFQ